MKTSPIPQHTDFPHDWLGCFTYNGLDEAMHGHPEDSHHGDSWGFHFLIIGEGPFGSAIARQVHVNSWTQRHRVKSMEARTRSQHLPRSAR